MSEHFPVVMVCGARQAGKTTLLNRFKEKDEKMQYVTLDYPRIRSLAKEDPKLFLQQYQLPLIIDEIQYAPELLPYIKIRTDRAESRSRFFPAKGKVRDCIPDAAVFGKYDKADCKTSEIILYGYGACVLSRIME